MATEIDAGNGGDWLVVTQVKSNRIVYFTDDPEYQPPMQADWCYVSPFSGDLPQGMTLRNCWRWRFDGMAFVDAGKPPSADKTATLLEHNRQTLLDLLSERIQALRRPLEPSTPQGHELRAHKVAAAKSHLAGQPVDAILLAAAAAHGVPVAAMARQVLALAAERQEVLARTEALRETLSFAIRHAVDQGELIALRHRIITEVAADRLEPLPPAAPHTRPPDGSEPPLADAVLEEERLRLRLQLRNRINDLRRPWVSHYLLDEALVARKAELASAVMRAGGAVPAGMDGSLLLSHAAARGQTLVEAAREVGDEMRQQREVLVETEIMKDAMLARIAAVKDVAAIHEIGAGIARLQLPQALG